MVLMHYGIPSCCIRNLRNQYTGQNGEHARLQFEQDRDPRELIFNLIPFFLVYSAVDHFNVLMTTKLAKIRTYFLPLTRDLTVLVMFGVSAGTHANPDGYPTSYLWEVYSQVISYWILLLDLWNLEEKKKLLIFPRYHQLDVVKKLVSDTQHHGPGRIISFQHSAGSGKSNSIVLVGIPSCFPCIMTMISRFIHRSLLFTKTKIVLDRQLQNTLMSFGTYHWASQTMEIIKLLKI